MDAPLATPRVLKVIDTVVGSEERRQSVLRAALQSSGQAMIPERLEDLLVFVRAHLLPALSDQIGPRLATVVLADIDFAIQKEFRKRGRSEDPPSSGRERAEPPPPSSNTIVDSQLSQTSRNGVPSSGAKPRCAVLVVDRDRVGASMLARGIIHSGCDVAVADAATIDTAVTGDFEPHVLILGERDAVEMCQPLRMLLLSRPNLAIVVRVGEHRRLAESMLHSVTASRRCASIPRGAPTLEVVGLARQLCAEAWAAATAAAS
jgi:hypothetical protein